VTLFVDLLPYLSHHLSTTSLLY